MSGFVGEGTPLTAQGTVDGTQAATYELPLLGRFVVESVVATIDATGGGDTTPTLTVLDKSGAVIARKSQSSKIPSGDTGDATWALRLADDLGAQGSGKAPVWGYYVPNAGAITVPGGPPQAAQPVWNGSLVLGTEMFTYPGGNLVPIIAGTYLIMASFSWTPAATAAVNPTGIWYFEPIGMPPTGDTIAEAVIPMAPNAPYFQAATVAAVFPNLDDTTPIFQQLLNSDTNDQAFTLAPASVVCLPA